MKLRDYQLEAKKAIYHALETRDDNPCVVIPTAGGKTPIIASVCHDVVTKWQGRALVLANVKELLEQARDKLLQFSPDLDIGIFCNGLGKKETDNSIILASIQSIFQKADLIGQIDLLLADEAQLIPLVGFGQYRTFIKALLKINPKLRIVGFTATPYRLKDGNICGEDGILNHICYEISVKELIDRGYLSPLISKDGLWQPDTTKFRKKLGEFHNDDVEKTMNNDEVIKRACEEIIKLTKERKSVIIFCCSVSHSQKVAQELIKQCDEELVGEIYGETLKHIRKQVIEEFKKGLIKRLLNVSVLTIGFDAPNIDSVVLLRPTLSPGLYYQMVGRGFRICDEKINCLVLDFAGNIARHGPVDLVEGTIKEKDEPLYRRCTVCRTYNLISNKKCSECGFVFPVKKLALDKAKHDTKPATADIVSKDEEKNKYGREWREIEATNYFLHKKKNASAGAPRILRVEHRLGFNDYVTEWICLEHDGYALEKAKKWWRKHCSIKAPDHVEKALELIDKGAIAPTKKIKVERKKGQKYPEVIDHVVGPIPNWTDEDLICTIPPELQEASEAIFRVFGETDNSYTERDIEKGINVSQLYDKLEKSIHPEHVLDEIDKELGF